MTLRADGVVFNRISLACARPADDPLRSRQRLARLLGGLAPQTAGLPGSAILCVRRLRDPLPGVLQLTAPDAGPPVRWQQALDDAIARLARGAARPVLGCVPANADAVWFADRAELLACLARDWLAGRLFESWWWRALLDPGLVNAGAVQAVVHIWRCAPEYAPTALDMLAGQRAAIPFAQALSHIDALELASAITRAHGLAEATLALQQAQSPWRSSVQGAGGRAGPPPWAAVAPEAHSANLNVAQAALLGAGLSLARAPARARQPDFAVLLTSWLSDAPRPPAPARPPNRAQPGDEVKVVPPTADVRARLPVQASAPPPRRRSQEPRADLAFAAPVRRASASRTMAPPPLASQPAEPHGASSPGRDTSVDAAPGLSDPAERSRSEPRERRRAVDQASPAPPLVTRSPRLDARVAPPAQPLDLEVDAFETDYGGAWFLVNLGLYQGYYADFTEPLRPSIDMNIYDFVRHVAEAMLSEVDRVEFRADALWATLARLADHADGEAEIDARDRAWLDANMPAIRTRLERALAYGGGNVDDAPRMLLALRARVVLGPARLDAHFSLAELPIAIRWSGLDRNPGWVPAAGRFIAFHFG